MFSHIFTFFIVFFFIKNVPRSRSLFKDLALCLGWLKKILSFPSFENVCLIFLLEGYFLWIKNSSFIILPALEVYHFFMASMISHEKFNI